MCPLLPSLLTGLPASMVFPILQLKEPGEILLQLTPKPQIQGPAGSEPWLPLRLHFSLLHPLSWTLNFSVTSIAPGFVQAFSILKQLP